MQTQGAKIKEIAKKRGLQMKWIAENSGWSEAGLSRKVNSGDFFTIAQLSEFSNLLGVTVEYIQDTSRVYSSKTPIPADAILKPPPPDTRDTDPIRLLS